MATSDSDTSKSPDKPDDPDKAAEAATPAHSEPAKTETPAAAEPDKDKADKDKEQPLASAELPTNLTESQQLHQHHVSKILDEVLEVPAEAPQPGRIKHPMVLDLIYAVSLLVAMGGFTIGLFKMYVAHSAQQSIMQHNYKAAIAILKGAPLPNFIAVPGGGPDSDPQELLNQALYLDGIDKLDNKTDINGGLAELQQVTPGSRFFALAQSAINENFEPSSTFLRSGLEHNEDKPVKEDDKPFNPELPKDAVP